ncbi:MAG: glycoside hydrolase family 3 C-terminal domain-containing protein [Bacteroidales bacterium]|nr:glycoside hydrolase family 3 C-terminal domain-containing protein [Bacteroidales bacterium]
MKNLILITVVFLLTAISCKKDPFQDPSLSSEERAKDLINRLTLEEKVTLMCDQSDAIPRLGIKKFNWWSEALHGLANNEKVTVFPEPVGMAASFDDDLVYRVFSAVSDEVRARYNEAKQGGQENRRFLSLSVWTPNINIFRDPRWGRGQETYGEDPYLTSRMGISAVKGLQGPEDAKYRKLLACAKHFAVHSGPEWSRHSLNISNLDLADLYETYLPAFKALVQEADVRQVMCAYQRLDEEPCCGNSRLLQKILREDWGYKYLVVSDCDAIADFYNGHKFSPDAPDAVSKSISAGTDLECAWQNYNYRRIPDAISNGLIKEEEIDKSLLRVLTGRFDLGEMDEDEIVPWTKISPSIINNEEHRELALEMARETMTLLQNKNNILPLSKSLNKIAVIGPNADNEQVLWGNYNGTPVRTITILDGIKTKIDSDRIIYEKGCELVDNNSIESYIPACSFEGLKGFRATYWNNNEFKGNPVTTMHIASPLLLPATGQTSFAPGVSSNKFSVRFETIFEPNKDENLVLRFGGTGLFELKINDESVKRYSNWRTVISKIPFSVEKGRKYKIEISLIQQNDWKAYIDFNFGKEKEQDYTDLITRLQGIELVIFAGGLSTLVEGEEMPVELPGFKGGDRTDIDLPEIQRNCIKALKQAGKRVVFVNCSGSAVGLVPETETSDAILQAWYAGEAGGQAVADILFGDYNPSGKLPVTFYKTLEQIPDFEDYSMKGRTYRFMSDPLFPFGFGLSYTSFSIGEASLFQKVIQTGENAEITIPVSNTGKVAGTEVVQVYIHKVNDKDGPIRTLRAFHRVNLAPGSSDKITIDLPGRAFEFFDKSSGKMVVVPGDYEVWYGNSSNDRDLKMVTITIL